MIDPRRPLHHVLREIEQRAIEAAQVEQAIAGAQEPSRLVDADVAEFAIEELHFAVPERWRMPIML